MLEALLDATLNSRPNKATHWSVRSLSAELGMPRDFVHRRYGTTTLFVALDVATGKVIGRIRRRHRSIDFIRFPRHVDQVVGSVVPTA